MAKSKYDKVFPSLKRLPAGVEPDDIDYQQKTDQVKTEILGEHDVPPAPDEVIHELITECLEEIADNVKIICQAVVRAPHGRHYASVFGRYWLELRRIKDNIESQEKNVELLLNAYEQLAVNQFEVEAAHIINFDDLGRVKTQPEIVAKVRDKDKLRQWYVDNGLFRELNPHHGAMQSLAKQRLLDSLEGHLEGLPDIPGVETYFNVKLTK